MGVPCVRVDRTAGEQTRQRLASENLLDEAHEIVSEGDSLYIPVTDPAALKDSYAVCERSPPRRERQATPADLLAFDPTYERVGEVVLIDEDDADRADALTTALLKSDIPVRAVLNRASKVKGRRRVRDWEILAGESTKTVHREHGHAFAVDLAEAYFSPRLATERHRVVEQVQPGEQVFDMFAGVGPFAVPMASRGATVVATDINPVAVEYLAANARRNGVAERVTAVCADVRAVTGDPGWADRLVMNLPHSADQYLETAVRAAGEECLIHYYAFAHEDDRYGPAERTIRAAVPDSYTVTVETRRSVRSYAPHEENVVLDVRLTRAASG
jgi:tRNA (guanine37-N1)-methyltransferase